jgi:pimeloyl-ACP methyl ester carboxylesterase
MTTTILIPGLLCDAFVWEPLVKKIEGAVRVADLSTQDDLTVMAKDCLAMAEGQLTLTGHSMGGRVAMEMARLAPERIERMVLLDTGIHPLKEGELEKRNEIVRLAHENGMQALVEHWLPGMVYEPNQKNKALMDGLSEMILRCDPDMHERQIRALVNRSDASAYLQEISCPVMLVVGREDLWSPVAQHEEMLTLLANPKLEIIEDAGHFAPVEKPDECSELCVEFINQ